jgi:hypothetical protein
MAIEPPIKPSPATAMVLFITGTSFPVFSCTLAHLPIKVNVSKHLQNFDISSLSPMLPPQQTLYWKISQRAIDKSGRVV